MSLEEKVGHLFLIGFPYESLNPNLEKHIHQNFFSNFILFKRNIRNHQQIIQLNKDLQKVVLNRSTFRALIAVDQEGGSVSRLPLPLPQPSALSLGKSKEPSLAYEVGIKIGEALAGLGFNINLAPVLDLADANKKSFIGSRSFGDNPEDVSNISSSFSKGLLEAFVIPTGKHFPGSGNEYLDPHLGHYKNMISYSDWLKNDQLPFAKFASIGEHSIMMLSHLSYPNLDAEPVSATYSYKIKEELLRQKVGFKGVILTDDLQMKGSTSQPAEGAVKALLAGSDMVMMTWSLKDQSEAVKKVKQSIKKQELTIDLLNQKVLRILRLKQYIKDHKLNLNWELWSKQFYQLDQKVVQAHFLNQNIKNSLKIKKTDVLCLLSNSASFIQRFQKNYSGTFSFFKYELFSNYRSVASNNSVLIQQIRSKQCKVLFITLGGEKTKNFVKKFLKNFSGSTVIISTGPPYLTQGEHIFKDTTVLNFFSNHASLPETLATVLSQSLL